MKKRMTCAILVALAALSSMASASAIQLPAWNKTEHMQYINGFADGTMRPDARVSRAEVSKMIAGLLSEQPDNASVGGKFSDVDASAWYADAVERLSGYSLINGYVDGTFRPNNTITRAELVSILARFPHEDIASAKRFSDVPSSYWASDAIAVAHGNGWVTGYVDGTFRPAAEITRAEAITMLNRVLGRAADAHVMQSADDIRIMPDVPKTHWAYAAMLEASTDHAFSHAADGAETWTSYDKEATDLAPGWQHIEGELFHVNTDQIFDRNTTVGGLRLDENGRYTSGSKELDSLLTAAAKKVITGDMTQMQRLRAMYDYAKTSFGYLGIGTVDTAVKGWDMEQAANMLKTGKGNCYSWASGFTYLAQKAGYPAVAVPGTGISPKGNESVHAWTEITIDGIAYTFDPQIESIYAANYGERYDLFMKPYGEAEWGYRKANDTGNGSDVGAGTETSELSGLMSKVYGEIKESNLALAETEVTKENMKYYLGVDDLEIKAGLASESLITAKAHSVVLVEMKDGADIETAKKTIAQNVDPYKWICVGVKQENVLVDNVGNTIVLIMDNTYAQDLLTNFRNAMK